MNARGKGILVASLLILLGAIPASADDPPASPAYTLERSTLSAAGGSLKGDLYRLTGSLGQPPPVPSSSSETHVIQSGFWCFLGTGPVPIVLTARPRPNGEVSLEWTGNASLYEIDRATVCKDIANGFLANTTQKNYTDASPPEARLVCYSVVGG